MKTCDYCIHYGVCGCRSYEEHTCENFKDKSLCIELPCPIGSRIYMIVTKRPKITMPSFSFVKITYLTYYNLERVMADFGKTVFLTREEAENALAERNRNESTITG